MGYGLFREPLHRQCELSADAHQQHGTWCTKRHELSIPRPVRNTSQGTLRHLLPITLPSTIPGTPGGVLRARLAAKCCQCIRPTRNEKTVELSR